MHHQAHALDEHKGMFDLYCRTVTQNTEDKSSMFLGFKSYKLY